MRTLPVAILAVLFTVAGCSHKPEEVVVTKEVRIAVPVPCKVDTKGKRPELLTLEQLRQRLAAAPNVDAKAKLISEQLLAHIGWLPVVEDALRGCQMEQISPSK